MKQERKIKKQTKKREKKKKKTEENGEMENLWAILVDILLCRFFLSSF